MLTNLVLPERLSERICLPISLITRQQSILNLGKLGLKLFFVKTMNKWIKNKYEKLRYFKLISKILMDMN